MLIEISLIAIGTAIIVSKILNKIKVTDKSTQTLQGLWLPQVAMWLDDSSDSVDTDLSVVEMELVTDYVSSS